MKDYNLYYCDHIGKYINAQLGVLVMLENRHLLDQPQNYRKQST